MVSRSSYRGRDILHYIDFVNLIDIAMLVSLFCFD